MIELRTLGALEVFVSGGPRGGSRLASQPKRLAILVYGSEPLGSWLMALAGAVVGLVVLAAGVRFVLVRDGAEPGSPPPRDRVVVVPPDSLTGDSTLEPVGVWAASYVREGLVEVGLAEVVMARDMIALTAEAEGLDDAAPQGLLRTWPRETGATLALIGEYYPRGDSLEVLLQVVDSVNTVLSVVDPVVGARQDLPAPLGALQMGAIRALAQVVSPGHAVMSSTAGRRPPALEAHTAAWEGWSAMAIEGSAAAIPHLRRARALDPDYFFPLYGLNAAFLNLGRRAQADSTCAIMEEMLPRLVRHERIEADVACAWTRGDWWTALEATKRLVEFQSNAVYMLGISHLDVNQPAEAVRAFSKYDPDRGSIARHWARFNWYWWSVAHHMLGEYEEELEVARRGSQSAPDHTPLVTAQVRALIALGRREEGLDLLEHKLARLDPGRDPTALLDSAARELDAHGYPEAARELWARLRAWYSTRPEEEVAGEGYRRASADLLLQLDRLPEAGVLVASLARDFPDSAPDQGRLGVLRAMVGDAAGAEAVCEVLAGWDEPYQMGRSNLWAAYLSAQLGKLDRAVDLLRDASQQGWNFRDSPHSDPFLRPLRDHPAFQELIRPKG